MNEIVSIILPVYKVEDYLDKCMESIVGQTYRELEIILVDDGSPDRCPALCDAWAARDSRVRVLHKANAGVGEARNSGMEIATGSYIMFVDPDDYLPPDAVQVLLERLVADGSDMAIGKILCVFSDGHTDGRVFDFMKDQLLTGEEFLTSMGGKDRYSVGPCARIFTRYALEGITFPPMSCGEDLWVFPLIILRCKTVSVVDHSVYCYYQRTTSISNSKKDPQKLEALQASQHMTEIFLRRGQLDCAARWFGLGLTYIQELEHRQAGIDLVKSLFPAAELQRMLRASDIATRLKWLLLHHPAWYDVVFGFKRFVTGLIVRDAR